MNTCMIKRVCGRDWAKSPNLFERWPDTLSGVFLSSSLLQHAIIPTPSPSQVGNRACRLRQMVQNITKLFIEYKIYVLHQKLHEQGWIKYWIINCWFFQDGGNYTCSSTNVLWYYVFSCTLLEILGRGSQISGSGKFLCPPPFPHSPSELKYNCWLCRTNLVQECYESELDDQISRFQLTVNLEVRVGATLAQLHLPDGKLWRRMRHFQRWSQDWSTTVSCSC